MPAIDNGVEWTPGDSMIRILAIGKASFESNAELCLTARAFGASGVTFSCEKDPKLIRRINLVSGRWGGEFTVDFQSDYRKALESFSNYKKVYLTRYGTPLQDILPVMKTYRNLLLIITEKEASKTAFSHADFSISITDQPHSGSAAVAIFLHEFYSGRELAVHFENARYKIVPADRGVHMEKIAQKLVELR